MNYIGIISRYRGSLVHDCWPPYFTYDQCSHALCGSHLTRELTFIVDSNQYQWARRMKRILLYACKRVNQSSDKKLSASEYRLLEKLYRKILQSAEKELPAIPERMDGKRGRIAKSECPSGRHA